jgi:hypothetical protein
MDGWRACVGPSRKGSVKPLNNETRNTVEMIVLLREHTEMDSFVRSIRRVPVRCPTHGVHAPSRGLDPSTESYPWSLEHAAQVGKSCPHRALRATCGVNRKIALGMAARVIYLNSTKLVQLSRPRWRGGSGSREYRSINRCIWLYFGQLNC